MDEDLLNKYFAGQCTPEEAESVRHWLSQPVVKENLLLKKSWRNIKTHIRTTSIQPLNSWPIYFAAASVVLLIVAGVSWKLISNDFIIQNTSAHYEAFDASGLQFKLPPQAAARINNDAGSKTADLKFCGDVRILNNSENDVDMKLNLNCVGKAHPDFTTVLRARKDKKYVAFQYHFKSVELVVVEEDRIFDLPLPLQKKALEVLEI